MRNKWARTWFGVTATCVLVGIILNVIAAAKNTSPAYVAGIFYSPSARVFNQFTYFSLLCNLIVGGTSALLALRLDRSSTIFRKFNLTGLVGIVITGVVYHVLLARLTNLETVGIISNQLLHTVIPILAVAGWLLFGPRGHFSRGIVWLSLIFPACWITFTLIRGAIMDWYPYPFVDVSKLGYLGVTLNCIAIGVALFTLAAGAKAVDRRLTRRLSFSRQFAAD